MTKQFILSKPFLLPLIILTLIFITLPEKTLTSASIIFSPYLLVMIVMICIFSFYTLQGILLGIQNIFSKVFVPTLIGLSFTLPFFIIGYSIYIHT